MRTNRSFAVPVVVLVILIGAAWAMAASEAPEARATLMATPAPGEYGVLATGAPVMVRDGQLLFVGQGGVRSLCPDGSYPMRSGQTLTVRRGKIITPEDITPPWVVKGLNPQPEPPLPVLGGTLIDGREVVTAGGKLLFLRTRGRRVACPDGEYALRGGGPLKVRGGVIVEPGRLAGLTPR